MREFITELWSRLQASMWNDDLRQLPAMRRQLVKLLRLLYAVVREFASGDLNLRAMSMVYTTLLSTVPLLAFAFSVLKGFGVHNQLEPVLHQFLAPLGPKGDELAGHILSFVSRMDVSVLGGVGLAMLIYTVLSLLQKIEAAFNHVWHIERTRGLGQRFSSYLSVVLVGPVLVFGALAITASVMNNRLVQWLIGIEPFGTLIVESSRLVPYLLIVGAFTFFYTFIPNTRVKLSAALGGGVIAGFLWQSTGWAFAAFIASSAQYAAIYSSFAILVLLLIWVYLNWLIVLIGAQIAFFIQNPHYLTRNRMRLELSDRLKEHLALGIMYLVADQHHRHAPVWTAPALAARLNLPLAPLERLIATLIAAGYLVETCEEPPALIAAQDTATVRVAELLDAVRATDESRLLAVAGLAPLAPVDAIVARIDAGRAALLGDLTLRDLLDDAGPD
ncbi:MAG: YihY/virulence factor BrkB family protein [Gammaproteobacteria bacterium]|nr:YihY/virulence factor BrkB family protein [Gammaproteobacteria bacterium]